jgi:hypothetical protein
MIVLLTDLWQFQVGWLPACALIGQKEGKTIINGS